jgi:ribonucleotide reductase alpha subunit
MPDSGMSPFALAILNRTYAHQLEELDRLETWGEIANRVTKHVMKAVGVNMRSKLAQDICKAITEKKIIPGGRYLYAAGNNFHQVNNCILLRAQDSREGWGELLSKSSTALMSGAGIGVVYSDIRAEGTKIRKTGGIASGPLTLMQIINECGRGVMQGGARRCLAGYSLVIMEDGSRKPIRDVQPGDKVWTRFGSRLVLASEKQRQEVFRITTEYGSVVCSANHRWLAARNDRKTSWYTTNQLRDDRNHKLYYHSIPQSGGMELDKEWMYTLGFYMGNGCAYSSGRTHEVTFQIGNKWKTDDQIHLIMSTMKRLFDVNPIERDSHGDCIEIRYRNKLLIPRFQKWKYPHECPQIPDEIYTASKDSKAAFLAGWFDSDGSYTEDRWEVSCKHKAALEGIQNLLQSLGILSTLNVTSFPTLRVCSYQRNLFMATIGKYTFKKPAEFTTHDHQSVPARILSIESIGVEDTYDIQVEGAQEFIADNHVSHNSAIWAGLNWAHADIHKFIRIKNWSPEVCALKAKDYNFPATLDFTNVSVGLDDEFFKAYHDDEHARHSHAHGVYWSVIEQQLRNGEPGFTVDIGENAGEILRNAPVSADTRVLTDIGYVQIHQIIDIPVTLWTGKQWAYNVVFTKTKSNVKTLIVSMSNGNKIKADPTHEFVVETWKKNTFDSQLIRVEKIPAEELVVGDVLNVQMPGDTAASVPIVTVIGVSTGPVEDVYCCNVNCPEHTFVAEGVTISNCGEVSSKESDDICNLTSLNLSKIESLDELKKLVELATAFLMAGSVYSDIPYSDIDAVRTKNRRLGLGLMGVHEWLLKRGKQYAPDEELGMWLAAYAKSGREANKWADEWGLSRPKKTRAIAPNGTTSIIAETTGGIEPIYCVAYKRRYLKGDRYFYQYVIDPCAKRLIETGVSPESIEDAYSLAQNVERRVAFQAWVQTYVDHCISSTINLPAFGTEFNNSDSVKSFGSMLMRYLPQLRGITCYPDGGRAGQPLSPVPYAEAVQHEGIELVEESVNVCHLRGGSCGD